MNIPTQLISAGYGFSALPNVFVDKITHTMLRLFPSISTALEQLCIFKTSAIAELPAAFKQGCDPGACSDLFL